MENSDFVDQKALLHFFQNELSNNKEIFGSLLEIFSAQLKQIESVSPNPQNYENLQKLAHKIKSGALSFGANRLFDQLNEIEQLLSKSSANPSLVQAKYVELVGTFKKSLIIVKEFNQQ